MHPQNVSPCVMLYIHPQRGIKTKFNGLFVALYRTLGSTTRMIITELRCKTILGAKNPHNLDKRNKNKQKMVSWTTRNQFCGVKIIGNICLKK